VGAEDSIVDHPDGLSSYLRVGRRTHSYQGPMLDLPPGTRECLLTDQDYLFSARIRIDPGAEYPSGEDSLCQRTGASCPRLQFSHMDAKNAVRWRELATTDNTGITDGEWFVVHKAFQINSRYLPVTPQDVYNLFTVNGAEPGIDISIDTISIHLPPAPQAYPDPASVCSNLVVNGDAERLGGFTYPLRPYIAQSTVTVEHESNSDFTDNAYFSVTNRGQVFDSIAVDINPECLQTSAVYSFSARIRLHSLAADTPMVKLVSTVPGQTGIVGDVVAAACPQTSLELGWVTCRSQFSVEKHLSTASQVQLLIVFTANQLDTADFDDISFTFQNAINQGGIELGDDLSQCYAPGAKALIPSDDLTFDSAQIVTLETLLSGTTVGVAEDIARVTTNSTDPDFAAEFALLSRNILFTGDDDGDNYGHGPAFVVLHTPDVGQLVRGVDFNGFGRASASAPLHPINFIASASTSTVVSQNTIQFSNYGCIELATTHNILVSENVAYNTMGDCFRMTSGVLNTFHRNLGAVTRISPLNVASCSTFYIGHPTNTFSGNVAAGSEQTGFFFQQHTSAMRGFSDSVAHSNSLYGFRSQYKPDTIETWTGSKAYRNLGHGMMFHQSQNIVLDGGVVADNRIGIDVWAADAITISGMKIMGSSDSFRNIAEVVPSTETQCMSATASPIYGVRIHPNAWVENAEGTKIDNVAFSDFAESTTGCHAASAAIAFNTLLIDPQSYTTTMEVTGSTFDASSASIDVISLCDTFTAGLFDVYVTDDGSINPAGNASGIVISNNSTVADPGTCVPMYGSCAQYCVPLGTATVGTGASAPATGDAADGAASSTADGDTGNGAASSTANGDASSTGNGAAFAPGVCITNGDFQSDTSSWFGKDCLVTFDGGYAKASQRTHQNRGGLYQKFDTACLAEEGAWYKIDMDVRLSTGGSIFACNPSDIYFDADNCAGIFLLVGEALVKVAYTVAPLLNNANGWTKMYGAFKVTGQMKNEPSIHLLVAGAPTVADISIDNLVISSAAPGTIGVTDCSNPLTNGNAEIGDAREWFIRGHGDDDSYIDMGSPGYNSAFAFKHVGKRGNKLYSMMQIMDNSCFPLGSTWTISAQFRLFDENGLFKTCDRTTLNGGDSCLVFKLSAGNIQIGPLDNQITTPVDVSGGWNLVENTFTVTADMVPKPEIWINVQVPVAFSYEIDDIKVMRSN